MIYLWRLLLLFVFTKKLLKNVTLLYSEESKLIMGSGWWHDWAIKISLHMFNVNTVLGKQTGRGASRFCQLYVCKNIVHGLIIGLGINGLNVTFSTPERRWRGGEARQTFILDNSDSTVNRQQNVVKMVIPTPVCIPYSAAPANRHYGPGISLE